jgi:hypothetical protein
LKGKDDVEQWKYKFIQPDVVRWIEVDGGFLEPRSSTQRTVLYFRGLEK